jgi:putative NADH-flavin reductase
MKIGVLGATGATGRKVIEQLGDTEHEVVAFVRHGRQTDFAKEMEVRAVDIFNSASLSGGFMEIDVLISTLGGFPGSFRFRK